MTTTGDKAELRELFDKTGATYSFLNDQRAMTFEQFVAAYNTRTPSPPSEVVPNDEMVRVALDFWQSDLMLHPNWRKDTPPDLIKEWEDRMRTSLKLALQAAGVSGVPEGCAFCGCPVGSDPVYDEANGETACKTCGGAERVAIRRAQEGHPMTYTASEMREMAGTMNKQAAVMRQIDRPVFATALESTAKMLRQAADAMGG